MELHLDRRLAEKRIFPAIDIVKSGTRREELLLGPDLLKQVYLLRRIVSMLSEDSPNGTGATERLMDRLAKTQNNASSWQPFPRIFNTAAKPYVIVVSCVSPHRGDRKWILLNHYG